MRPTQLALAGVNEAVTRILVGDQYAFRRQAQQPFGGILATAVGGHETDRHLTQGHPHPAALTAPLVPGFIGMEV